MKKLTTLIIISNLLWLGELKAQFNIDWEYDYQHANAANFSNEARKVAVDSASGLIYTLSDVSSNLDSNGAVTGLTYNYAILSQFDLGGNLIKTVEINVGSHSVSGFDLKSGFGLELDNSGDVYIGYMSYDAVSSFDVNLSKYNDQLNPVWEYKFNALTEDIGIAMVVSNTGSAFAILKSTSGVNIRHRIIKADATLTTAAPLYTYSSQPDYLADLVVDASQKVYTTGYRLIAGIKTILVSCVNGSGTLLWSRVDNCGTTTGDDFSRDINMGGDGYLYITGSSQGTVQHGLDAVIMKFHPVTGKKMWDSFINFNLTDGGYKLVNPDPNFVFVSWLAFGTVYIDQISANDGTQIRRLSYTPVPVSSFNSLGNATITDMKLSSRQNIYLTGSISGTNAGQDFSATYLIRANFSSRGLPAVDYALPVTGQPSSSFRSASIALDESYDHIYLLKDESESFTTHLQETVWLQSISVPGFLRTQNSGIETTDQSLLLETGPNPVSNELYIRTNNAISLIEISDLNGKLLVSEKVSGLMNATLDVSQLSGGMYFVRIYDVNGANALTKIIK